MRSICTRRNTVAALLAGASLATAILAATPAHAGTTTQAGWWCQRHVATNDGDAGGRSSHINCGRDGDSTTLISAAFRAHDEILVVDDNHYNNRRAVAHLDVENKPITVTKGAGEHDLNYPEGRGVQLQICTSNTAGAVCGTVAGAVT